METGPDPYYREKDGDERGSEVGSISSSPGALHLACSIPIASLASESRAGSNSMASQLEDMSVEDLIDEAWEASKPKERASLARQALSLDPDALDAYVILASCVDTFAEKTALLREAIRRGQIIWADDLARPPKHFFYGVLETRPFMRAIFNLMLLMAKRDLDEAVSLAQKLLRLNADDNMGARYLLLAWLPVLGDWTGIEKLLKKYKDDYSAEFLYAHCLNAIRRGENAEPALSLAFEYNPHIPALLLAEILPAATKASLVSTGSKEEALSYAEHHQAAWRAVPGALDWLRDHSGTK